MIINWLRETRDIYYFFNYFSWDNDSHRTLTTTPSSASNIQSGAGLPSNWNHTDCSIVAWLPAEKHTPLKWFGIYTDEPAIGVKTPESTDEAMVQLEKWIYQVEEGKISEIEIRVEGDAPQYLVYGRKKL